MRAGGLILGSVTALGAAATVPPELPWFVDLILSVIAAVLAYFGGVASRRGR